MKHQLFNLWSKGLLLIVGLVLLLSSCENEILINAKYKETIIVFALLDPNDTIQYIKVNKAYLDESRGALETAKISDSLYLDSTHVELKRISTGEQIVFSADNTMKKDSGIFANNKNILWVTRARIYPNEEYEITVSNPVSKTKAVSYTRTVGLAKIRAPFQDQTNIFSVGPEYITVSFNAGSNSYAYDIRFHVFYEEINTLDTNKKTEKMASWKMVNNLLVGNNASPLRQIPRLSFLQFLQTSISASPTLKHRIKWVGVTFYGGNQTLSDYISVNEPSIGIVQKQAEFTNINGGYGLFASRCTQKVWNVPIDGASIAFLQKNEWTKSLNFIF